MFKHQNAAVKNFEDSAYYVVSTLSVYFKKNDTINIVCNRSLTIKQKLTR